MKSIKPCIALVGPTATGKTDLAFALAKQWPVELINLDSLQLYRHMNIGTAKPSQDTLAQYPHHLFDILNPDQHITALAYAELVKPLIENIHARHGIPILVGGSGFYLQALSNQKSFLPGTLENESIETLYADIQKSAPHIAKNIHANDTYRIRRVSYLIKHDPNFSWEAYTAVTQQASIHCFAIEWPRKQLYTRINQRVLDMFEQGLINETRTLLHNFPDCEKKLSRTIGYAQCLQLINNKLSLDQAIEQTQQKTRNYAKRQTTWFKHRGNTTWFAYPEIFDKLNLFLEKGLNRS